MLDEFNNDMFVELFPIYMLLLVEVVWFVELLVVTEFESALFIPVELVKLLIDAFNVVFDDELVKSVKLLKEVKLSTH